jgi:hypothetical protein
VAEFIFMLTRNDQTVLNALDVYDQIRETDIRLVGFKDIGLPVPELKRLASRIRDDGRQVVLEVVSVDREAELRSISAGLEIGVDVLMGGTRAAEVAPLLEGRDVRYFPFPGRVVGHPSVLEGTIEEIAASASALTDLPGVHGVDLLAYRFAGDVPALIRAVVGASTGPVVAAGSIASDERIRVVTSLGVWGFTIGSAIFDGSYLPGADVKSAVTAVLEAARAAEWVTGVGVNSSQS